MKTPPLRSFDNEIGHWGGSTFALDLQPWRLQSQKVLDGPKYEDRLIELVKESSAYRRELHFFREVYHAAECFQKGVRDIRQQLILHYYLGQGVDDSPEDQWLTLADELDAILQKYTSAVNEAAADWIELTREQAHNEEMNMV